MGRSFSLLFGLSYVAFVTGSLAEMTKSSFGLVSLIVLPCVAILMMTITSLSKWYFDHDSRLRFGLKQIFLLTASSAIYFAAARIVFGKIGSDFFESVVGILLVSCFTVTFILVTSVALLFLTEALMYYVVQFQRGYREADKRDR